MDRFSAPSRGDMRWLVAITLCVLAPVNSKVDDKAFPVAPGVWQATERDLYENFRRLQQVNATQNTFADGARFSVRLGHWGFFWSHNNLALVILTAVKTQRTLCLHTPTSDDGPTPLWPYQPEAEFEHAHNCS